MKIMLMKLMIMISSVIPIMKNPMSMGILLLLQTTLSTMLMSSILKNSWMPMIMFLMMIGGLLILFMYMSSIASNEKFIPNLKVMFLMMILIIPAEEMIIGINNLEFNMNLMEEMYSMSKIYNMKYMLLTMFMFMYLLLTMIVVSKIIKIYQGPLRSLK